MYSRCASTTSCRAGERVQFVAPDAAIQQFLAAAVACRNASPWPHSRAVWATAMPPRRTTRPSCLRVEIAELRRASRSCLDALEVFLRRHPSSPEENTPCCPAPNTRSTAAGSCAADQAGHRLHRLLGRIEVLRPAARLPSGCCREPPPPPAAQGCRCRTSTPISRHVAAHCELLLNAVCRRHRRGHRRGYHHRTSACRGWPSHASSQRGPCSGCASHCMRCCDRSWTGCRREADLAACCGHTGRRRGTRFRRRAIALLAAAWLRSRCGALPAASDRAAVFQLTARRAAACRPPCGFPPVPATSPAPGHAIRGWCLRARRTSRPHPGCGNSRPCGARGRAASCSCCRCGSRSGCSPSSRWCCG